MPSRPSHTRSATVQRWHASAARGEMPGQRAAARDERDQRQRIERGVDAGVVDARARGRAQHADHQRQPAERAQQRVFRAPRRRGADRCAASTRRAATRRRRSRRAISTGPGREQGDGAREHAERRRSARGTPRGEARSATQRGAPRWPTCRRWSRRRGCTGSRERARHDPGDQRGVGGEQDQQQRQRARGPRARCRRPDGVGAAGVSSRGASVAQRIARLMRASARPGCSRRRKCG